MGAYSRIALSWVLALIIMVVALPLYNPKSLPVGGAFDGLMGIGLIIGLPMLIFTIPAGVLLNISVGTTLPFWAASLISSCACGSAFWLISEYVFPAGWGGAAQAYTIFAFLYGLSWGVLSSFRHRRTY